MTAASVEAAILTVARCRKLQALSLRLWFRHRIRRSFHVVYTRNTNAKKYSEQFLSNIPADAIAIPAEA